jgi:ABC-type phosphate/phosphonate transport system ATPase subunit
VAYPGGVVALHGVSLEVRAGEAVELVVAIGAVKTTLL